MTKHDKTYHADPARARTRPSAEFDPESTNLAQPSKKGELPLPHERDEAPEKDDGGVNRNRGRVEQAHRDVSRGLQDTERRGVPSDVPGPGAQKPDPRGADVPADAAPERPHSGRPGGNDTR
jgi:hypothetical protein